MLGAKTHHPQTVLRKPWIPCAVNPGIDHADYTAQTTAVCRAFSALLFGLRKIVDGLPMKADACRFWFASGQGILYYVMQLTVPEPRSYALFSMYIHIQYLQPAICLSSGKQSAIL